MSSQMDFKDVESRTIRMINFEDGLWDLLLGLIVLALAFYPVSRQLLGPGWNILLFLGFLALTVYGQQAIRRRVAGPRMGRVRPRRTPKLRLVLVALFLMVVATLGLLLLTFLSPGWLPSADGGAGRTWLQAYGVDIGVALLFVVLFGLMAYQFDVPRLYVYGWLLGLGNLASVLAADSQGWVFNLPLAIAAGIILWVGLRRLIKFLQTYPVHEEGV